MEVKGRLFILQSFVTKFWKTTHMGGCEIIRISEFSALLFRAENYFWNISVAIRHWEWLEAINICTIGKVCDLIIRCQMHPYGWFSTKIRSHWTWLSLPYAMVQACSDIDFFGIRLLSWLESYHDHHNYCLLLKSTLHIMNC